MPTNRIRQYDQVWNSQTPSGTALPSGFVAYSLQHLNPAQQSAVAAAAPLYQWAFDRAREEVELRFVNDWVI